MQWQISMECQREVDKHSGTVLTPYSWFLTHGSANLQKSLWWKGKYIVYLES